MVDSESAAVKKSSNEKQQSIIRHSYHFNFVLCSHANHIIIVTCIQFCLHNGKVTKDTYIIIYKCNNVNWFLFQVGGRGLPAHVTRDTEVEYISLM